MKLLRYGALAVALIAVIGVHGCKFSTANIKQAVMATAVDKENLQPLKQTKEYCRADTTFLCSVQYANCPSETKVTAKWYSYSTEGEALFIDSTDITVEGDGWIRFSLPPSTTHELSDGFVYGKYQVQVLLNGVLDRTVPFTVERKYKEGFIGEAQFASVINLQTYYPLAQSDIFSPNVENVYACIYVIDLPESTRIEAKWCQDLPQGKTEIVSAADYFSGTMWIPFSFTPKSPLPPGTYYADFYVNNVIWKSLPFTVKQS